MLRTRQIAASPVRSASATWAVIADLIADTVAASPVLSRTEAEDALHAASAVGRVLIAAGHLDRSPITLVAGTVHCEITTVSGTAALAHEENLLPVPGASGAQDFTVYLPSPDPLHDQVEAAASGHLRLSATAAPAPPAAVPRSGPLLDQAALRQAAGRTDGR